MVILTRLNNLFDRTTKRLIAVEHLLRVFRVGHDRVLVAVHQQQWYFGLRKRREVVHGVELVCDGLLVVLAVVRCKRLIRVSRRPVHAIQATSTQPDQSWLGMHAVIIDHRGVKLLPLRHRLRGTEEVGSLQVRQVPAGLHERNIGISKRVEELTPPHPRPAGEWLAWHDDDGIRAFNLEVVTGKPLPLGGCAGKWLRIGPTWGSNGKNSEKGWDRDSHGEVQ